jgi:hypothetical protein
MTRALVAGLTVITASTRHARSDPLFEFFYCKNHLIFHLLSLSLTIGSILTAIDSITIKLPDRSTPRRQELIHPSAAQLSVSMRVSRVVAWLRVAAVGNFVAGITVTFARNTVHTIGSDTLLQFFYFQVDLVFHHFHLRSILALRSFICL